MSLAYCHMPSPVGDLLLAGDGAALHFISFATGHKSFGPAERWVRDDMAFAPVKAQLAAYFAGELREFDLALHLDGTEFQNAVWRKLAEIPYGETRSYGWLAAAVGNVKASRAVGAANGNNPLPIVLPCHRVIGADGAMTGFGGGLPIKRYLLALEARQGVLI